MATVGVSFFLLVGVALSSCLELIQLPTQCDYDGKVYEIGEDFRPTPCEFCHCDESGLVYCAIADCFYPPPCWDLVHRPDECCPSCPNGYNCKVPDSDQLVSLGQDLTLDDGRVCSCDLRGHRYWPTQLPLAVCSPSPSATE